MGRTFTSVKRRADIKERVANPNHTYSVCIVMGCGQPPMARQRSGLNKNYCRSHVEHFRRHGSYSKNSYRAAELSGYKEACLRWLRANRDRASVGEAVERVRTLLWSGGRSEEAYRLAGKSPKQRAKILLARLRDREVDPLLVLAIWGSVALRHRYDPQPERKSEYVQVQVGKVLHRTAGGSHKRWEQVAGNGDSVIAELHKYPASRGLVLRHIGKRVAVAAFPISVEMLEAVSDTLE